MEAKISDSRQIVNSKKNKSVKTNLQKFGTKLSGMIMPNISALIAWGLITAIFMSAGWFPNAHIATLIDPMKNYLIPLLIAYVGGRMVYEERGAVVGAIAVMGVIVGSNIPMFLGAMIMGPLGGWIIKKFDQIFKQRIKTGFEMLYDNFSAGIIGMLLAIFGLFIVNPLVVAGNNVISEGVNWIISVRMLPLANIFIEPAKVLFLNNAVGNGILVPLGIQQAAASGRSILFLLEANPGPGLGILLALIFFGKGMAKASAPGAAIIQFFGGIHEIYFPYILMKPALILAAITGGVTGTFTFSILNTGLKAAASPGSIIAVLLMTPRGNYLQIIIGVIASAIVSFIVAAIVLKFDKSEDQDLASSQAKMQQMKAESKGFSTSVGNVSVNTADNIQKVIFACDAGMGSSAMGASLLRDKFKKAGLNDIPITNTSISHLEDEPDALVITQEGLADRAMQKSPSSQHVSVGNFLNSDKYDEIINIFKNSGAEKNETPILNGQSSDTLSTNENEGITYSDISEIDFAYVGQIKGSSTMAASLFKNNLKRFAKDIPVKVSNIEEISDEPGKLVITTKDIERNKGDRFSKAHLIGLDNLIDTDQLAKLISSIK